MMWKQDLIGRAEIESEMSVFNHGVNLLGGPRKKYAGVDYDKMAWYVLNNCTEVQPYLQYVISSKHVKFILD